jgi:hypothetical protein
MVASYFLTVAVVITEQLTPLYQVELLFIF